MVTDVSEHVCHLGGHLGLFKNRIFIKIAANFPDTSEKYVFITVSNRDLIKKRVENKKLKH